MWAGAGRLGRAKARDLLSELGDYEARIVLDSVSEAGKRLTTLELNMPRFMLAQFNTHRALSRNAASSRAIPTAKLIERVRENPFVPAEFGANQRGMQASAALPDTAAEMSEKHWLMARDHAVLEANCLLEWGLHKQWANRLLEPFLWVKVLVSATEWANFFRLRLHEDAQPEFQRVAQAIKQAREESEPQLVGRGEWHLPYVSDVEVRESGPPVGTRFDLRALSVARCARLSPSTPEKDMELYERLLHGSGFGHWSPFEHVATPLSDPWEHSANFVGWVQWRKHFVGECALEAEPERSGFCLETEYRKV